VKADLKVGGYIYYFVRAIGYKYYKARRLFYEKSVEGRAGMVSLAGCDYNTELATSEA
jgi:hypothetical protein